MRLLNILTKLDPAKAEGATTKPETIATWQNNRATAPVSNAKIFILISVLLIASVPLPHLTRSLSLLTVCFVCRTHDPALAAKKKKHGWET